MIQKLRRKLVLIVMSVVALILLTIFFTMLYVAQNNSERMSLGALRQALNVHAFPTGERPSFGDRNLSPSQELSSQMRLPVLIVEVNKAGDIEIQQNQLHFIEDTEIIAISEQVLSKGQYTGVLSNDELRYLRVDTKDGAQIAFIDISVEQELLKTQVANSLLIGGLALVAFFILSLFLARWAVRPVQIAWEQQKQFVANASHELKTPLTVILSNAEMLRTEIGVEDSKKLRRMEHIHAEAIRMKELVEDMLILAMLDSQEKAEIHSATDFSYIVKNAVLVYEPILYDEDKRLCYEIEENLSVMGDTSRLQQMIHVLLDNARKYSSARGAIHVKLMKAEGKTLLLEVSNEGIPIPKEDLKKIFLRFYRRDESRSAHGSFGLGLSIAQSIAHGHKGSIWADSDGKSSNRFSVSLPLL